MRNTGVKSIGIKAPLIREGDNIVDIVVDSVLKSASEISSIEYIKNSSNLYDANIKHKYTINDKDIIGITESVVARAQGNYVTVDDVAKETERLFGKNPIICLVEPIYSRNRFGIILKGIARAAKKLYIVMPDLDEVGNPNGVNPFTGVNIMEYYKEICTSEDCECVIFDRLRGIWNENPNLRTPGVESISEFKEGKNISGYLDCRLHLPTPHFSPLGFHSWHCFYPCHTLDEICEDKCEYGVLGSNKASEERLKLFPNKIKAQAVVDEIKAKIKEKTGKDVIVMIYGDGSYKDLDSGIYEMADPVSSPAYTDADLLNNTPNEVKVKALIDDKYATLEGEELMKAIDKDIAHAKTTDLKGSMLSQGTTPRRYINLLASLMDLTSGSGMRETPIVLVQNYF